MKLFPTLLRRRTLAQIAEAELLEAQLQRMRAQSAAEHAQSVVDRYSETIERLKAALSDKTLVERGELA